MITHLEMLRDKKDCARSLNMSACVSAYVDPLHRLSTDEGAHKSDVDPSSLGRSPAPRAPSKGDLRDDRSSIFKRATDFLRQGLGFDESGGGRHDPWRATMQQ